MRYRIRITRVQFAERTVSATDEEAAQEKMRQELERPYGLLGAWTNGEVAVEILGGEPGWRVTNRSGSGSDGVLGQACSHAVIA
jgi:hypothetical protein